MVREQSEPAEAPAPQEAEEDESDRKIIRERLAEIGSYPERMLCGKALEEKMKRWGKPVSEVMGKVRTKRKSIPHIWYLIFGISNLALVRISIATAGLMLSGEAGYSDSSLLLHPSRQHGIISNKIINGVPFLRDVAQSIRGIVQQWAVFSYICGDLLKASEHFIMGWNSKGKHELLRRGIQELEEFCSFLAPSTFPYVAKTFPMPFASAHVYGDWKLMCMGYTVPVKRIRGSASARPPYLVVGDAGRKMYGALLDPDPASPTAPRVSRVMGGSAVKFVFNRELIFTK